MVVAVDRHCLLPLPAGPPQLNRTAAVVCSQTGNSIIRPIVIYTDASCGPGKEGFVVNLCLSLSMAILSKGEALF